jgi:hypothetical protein
MPEAAAPRPDAQPEINPADFPPYAIRTLRRIANMSQLDLAAEAKVNAARLITFEHRHRTLTSDELGRMLEVLVPRVRAALDALSALEALIRK